MQRAKYRHCYTSDMTKRNITSSCLEDPVGDDPGVHTVFLDSLWATKIKLNETHS